MLQRYLGNKTSLSAEIVQVVRDIAPPGSHVCDAFAGSIAVGIALKRAGYVVSSNDANLLSWIYAEAYLGSQNLPEIDLDSLYGNVRASAARDRAWMRLQQVPQQSRWLNYPDLQRAIDWCALLSELATPLLSGEIPKRLCRTDMFDHYSPLGEKSRFHSSRGSSGTRRFFSAENAKLLDSALSRLRYWVQQELLSERARCLATACLLDATEKIANTQGTYHDFPRDFFDPRALKSLSISMPDYDALTAGPVGGVIGRAEDSLEFIKRVPSQAVLYLDPPYNFRQYSAYYFLPNLIAEYPDVVDLDDYFSKLRFVRGQNMESDFTSSFCSSRSFLPSLELLIERADCQYVVLSYFNGRNHWHEFKSGTSDRGRLELEEFLSSGLFVRESLRMIPLDRVNYQSYGGHKALKVSEYLFIAERRKFRDAA